jgi:hypothetical protein
MAWAGIKNGALLSLAAAEFDALITIDQGFAYQQDLKERRIAILLLVSRSNQIEDLVPIVPAALTALETILPGQGRANRPVVIFRVCLGRGQAIAQYPHFVRGALGEIERFSGALKNERRKAEMSLFSALY